jgi:thiol-disulfide isomerase/thioredoxin
MKIYFFVLFVLVTQISFGQASGKPTTNNADSNRFPQAKDLIDKPFPAFTASNQGVPVSNDLLKGKVVVINFWFESCQPCMAEMPMLNEINGKFKDNKDFLFVSFTADKKESIQRVKDKYGITFQILSTNQKECDRLNVGRAYPATIILDKTGAIKYLHGGFFDMNVDFGESATYNEYLQKTIPTEIKSLL